MIIKILTKKFDGKAQIPKKPAETKPLSKPPIQVGSVGSWEEVEEPKMMPPPPPIEPMLFANTNIGITTLMQGQPPTVKKVENPTEKVLETPEYLR
mgnify:CR=1 FL=1